jgi:hypothetical protein
MRDPKIYALSLRVRWDRVAKRKRVMIRDVRSSRMDEWPLLGLDR